VKVDILTPIADRCMFYTQLNSEGTGQKPTKIISDV